MFQTYPAVMKQKAENDCEMMSDILLYCSYSYVVLYYCPYPTFRDFCPVLVLFSLFSLCVFIYLSVSLISVISNVGRVLDNHEDEIQHISIDLMKF